MAPILKELSEEYKGRVIIKIIEIDQERELTQVNRIRLIPTQIFFDSKNKEVFRHEGFMDKEAIKKVFERWGLNDPWKLSLTISRNHFRKTLFSPTSVFSGRNSLLLESLCPGHHPIGHWVRGRLFRGGPSEGSLILPHLHPWPFTYLHGFRGDCLRDRRSLRCDQPHLVLRRGRNCCCCRSSIWLGFMNSTSLSLVTFNPNRGVYWGHLSSVSSSASSPPPVRLQYWPLS